FTIERLRRAGELPQPRQPGYAGRFPFQWQWQPVASWWIVAAVEAELADPRERHDIQSDPIQRYAYNDTRLHRQQALDYRRPADATARLERIVYEPYLLDRLRDAFVYPPMPDDPRRAAGPSPVAHTGVLLGGTQPGSPLTALSDALRRL